MGGIGKTELAHRFIAEYHEKYSVLLFLVADSTDRLSRSYKQIAGKLGLISELDKPSRETCREALKAWFKNPRATARSSSLTSNRLSEDEDQPMLQWLLVLDNVEDWASLAPFWPEKGCGSVLVTSRKPQVLAHLVHSGPTVELKLTALSITQAGHLLKHYAGYDEDESGDVLQAAQQITNRLGNIPLAVLQVGSYIKQCGISIPRFSQIHRNESGLHHVHLQQGRVHDYEHNLASVWVVEFLARDQSFDAHDPFQSPSVSEDGSRQAFAILCHVSLLDPEGISEDLMRPDDKHTIILNYPTTDPEFYMGFRRLINFSLVERDCSKSEPSKSEVRVHRIVQQVV